MTADMHSPKFSGFKWLSVALVYNSHSDCCSVAWVQQWLQCHDMILSAVGLALGDTSHTVWATPTGLEHTFWTNTLFAACC